MIALEMVLRFPKGIMSFGLKYTEFLSMVERYTDANWISDLIDLKSTLGHVFLFGGEAIQWKFAKQKLNAKSTMKVELIALDSTCTEAKRIKNFFRRLLLFLLLYHLLLYIVIQNLLLNCASVKVLTTK